MEDEEIQRIEQMREKADELLKNDEEYEDYEVQYILIDKDDPENATATAFRDDEIAIVDLKTNEINSTAEWAFNIDEDIFSELENNEYAKADFKTEEQLFVSGINCEKETAYQEMIETKKKFGKEKGVLAFHAFQSFKEGEVTPEQAHEIGVKLAEELWGDEFEVLVSTHLNTDNLHNHFVLNSVSFVNGRKYRDTRRTYALMRKTSDDLCREYNLSVLEEKPCGTLNKKQICSIKEQ